MFTILTLAAALENFCRVQTHRAVAAPLCHLSEPADNRPSTRPLSSGGLCAGMLSESGGAKRAGRRAGSCGRKELRPSICCGCLRSLPSEGTGKTADTKAGSRRADQRSTDRIRGACRAGRRPAPRLGGNPPTQAARDLWLFVLVDCLRARRAKRVGRPRHPSEHVSQPATLASST